MTTSSLTRTAATLANGIPVTLFHKAGAPITLEVIFDGGSRWNRTSTNGEAHFVEHMLLAGSERFPTKDVLAQYMDPTGGNIGGATSVNSLVIRAVIGHERSLPILATALEQTLLHSRFDPKTVESERGSIMQEMSSAHATPNKKIEEVYRKAMFPDCRLSYSTLGSREGFATNTADTLKDFYSEFQGRGIRIIVAGDTTLEHLYESLSSALHGMSAACLPDTEANASAPGTPWLGHSIGGAKNTAVRIGWKLPATESRDAVPSKMLINMLAGGRGSRLARRLRYERGLVYSINSFWHGFPGANVAGVETECSPENLAEVIQIVKDELKIVQDGGISAQDVSLAAEKYQNSLPITEQKTDNIISTVRHAESFTAEGYRQDEIDGRYKTVTADELTVLAQSYFTENLTCVSLCGNVSNR